jgi:hypothetical protein
MKLKLQNDQSHLTFVVKFDDCYYQPWAQFYKTFSVVIYNKTAVASSKSSLLLKI